MLSQKLLCVLATILPIHWLALLKSDRRVGKPKISFQFCLMPPPYADLRLLAPCLPGMPRAASWPRAHLWLQWHRRVPEPSCRGSWGRGGELRLLQGRKEGGVAMELGNCAAAFRNQSSLALLQRLGVILLYLSGDNLNHLGQRRSVSFSWLPLQSLFLLPG